MFQSKTADVLQLTDELLKMFRSLVLTVVESSFVQRCADEDLITANFHEPVSSIYFGFEFDKAALS